jgi:hypothetical protein
LTSIYGLVFIDACGLNLFCVALPRKDQNLEVVRPQLQVFAESLDAEREDGVLRVVRVLESILQICVGRNLQTKLKYKSVGNKFVDFGIYGPSNNFFQSGQINLCFRIQF